jgi:hypothetical protein
VKFAVFCTCRPVVWYVCTDILGESSPSINLMTEPAYLSGVVTIYHTKRHHTHKDSNLHSRCRRNLNLVRNCVVMCQECAVRYLWLGYVIWRLDMASTGWSEVRILEIHSEGEPQEYGTCSRRPWPSDTTFVRHLLCLPAPAVYHCDSTKNAGVIRMWKFPSPCSFREITWNVI